MNINIIKSSVKKNKNSIIGEDSEYSKYSVVIPLIWVENSLSILFEVRSKKMKSQPGEISFPGGRIEEGEDSLNAAVRETIEELGIPEDNIEIIGPADMLITQHYKIIYSYAVLINSKTKLNPSEGEVDHIFFVPLDFFLNNKPLVKNIKIITEPEEDIPYESLKNSEEYKWITGRGKVYFYKYNDYIIWGITAKIMNNFINIITNKK